MKNRNLETITLVGALFIITLFLTGCKNGDESLGKDLLPGSSVVYSRNYYEAGTIQSFTVSDDKIRMDHPSFNYVGSFNDPLFGRTDGGFAAQYRLTANPEYDPNSVLDSLILRLTYKHVYGDTLTKQTLRVYELNGDLDYDAKYLSSFKLKTLANTNTVGTVSFIPKFKTDSGNVDTTIQYVRLKLDPDLGNRLLKIDTTLMRSNEDFLTLFKGLYIESDPTVRRGTLVGLTPTGSAMGLYYHTDKKDSLFFSYNVTNNSANVASFNHDYQKSAFFAHMNQEVIQDTLNYLQPGGGTKVKINIASLNKWKDSTQYVISKATMVFFVDTLVTDFRRYSVPDRLYLKYMDSSNVETFPKDSQLSSTYYDGIYDATTASYTFNITRHIEQIIKGDIQTTSLYLVHSDRNGSASRVVLKGGNSSQPIQLSIKYTRYK